MTDVATSMLALCAIAVLGLAIGQIKLRGVGLGLGGVLFGGIAIGHLAPVLHLDPDMHVLEFMREFGLILFVYTIGIQVGPGFFAAMRRSGLRLNALSASVVLLGVIVAVVTGYLAHLPLPVMLGILSGAVTNTPSLAATQQVLNKLGFSPEELALPALAYAVAYPIGILGILLATWLVRVVLKISIDAETKAFERDREHVSPALQTMNVCVKNANFQGLPLHEVPGMDATSVVCSRLKRNGELSVPNRNTRVQLEDVLHLVGPESKLHDMQRILGEISSENLSTKDTVLRVVRVVVTKPAVLGKTLAELKPPRIFSVNWFRKGADGGFAWPGFGDNMRVLKWIVQRANGDALGHESPLGWMPRFHDLDWRGMTDFTPAQFELLMAVDPDQWKQELLGHEQLLVELYDRLPTELLSVRNLLLSGMITALTSPPIAAFRTRASRCEDHTGSTHGFPHPNAERT